MKFFARHTLSALALMAAVTAASVPALADVTLRAAVGTPLKAASAALSAGRFAQAQAQLRRAEAVPGLSAEESFVILQMHASIAGASRDYPAATRYYQQMLNSGRVSGAEENTILSSLASISYSAKNYAATIGYIEKLQHNGGATALMNGLLIDALYYNGNYAEAARLQAGSINAAMRAGRAPSENDLQMLASCHDNLHNAVALQQTMQLLVIYYPKPDYWKNLIHAVQINPEFADRLQLDLMRFKYAAGLMTSAEDYFETILLALQEPLPGEAQLIMNDAYAKGIFGTGPDAARQARLKVKVAATAAEVQKTLAADVQTAMGDRDGTRLFALAEIYVGNDNVAHGIELMQAAMAKDSFVHPDDAKLHLALAYLKSGDKLQAKAMLKTITGTDGTADIARLWLLHIGR
jgi:Tfp pilus assembly protein PilF